MVIFRFAATAKHRSRAHPWIYVYGLAWCLCGVPNERKSLHLCSSFLFAVFAHGATLEVRPCSRVVYVLVCCITETIIHLTAALNVPVVRTVFRFFQVFSNKTKNFERLTRRSRRNNNKKQYDAYAKTQQWRLGVLLHAY